MELANLITAFTAPTPLPDWRTNPRLQEPAKAIADARAAIEAANAKVHTNAALLVAIEADLKEAADIKQATALDDRREEVLGAIAAAEKERARAERARAAADRIARPIEIAAKRQAARELRERFVAQAARVAEANAAAEKEARELDRLRDHVWATLGDERTEFGLVDADAAPEFNVDLLAIVGRLHTIYGRNFEKLQGWLALAKSVGAI